MVDEKDVVDKVKRARAQRDPEVDAIGKVNQILETLPVQARLRVLEWARQRATGAALLSIKTDPRIMGLNESIRNLQESMALDKVLPPPTVVESF
jgi:hypothetical protein